MQRSRNNENPLENGHLYHNDITNDTRHKKINNKITVMRYIFHTTKMLYNDKYSDIKSSFRIIKSCKNSN